MTGERTAQQETDRRHTMRTIFGICNEAGIDRADRIELASALLDLGTGLESYNDLSDEDLGIVYWALRHWKVIQQVRLLNGTLSSEAHVIIEAERLAEIEEDSDVRKPIREDSESKTDSSRTRRSRVERDEPEAVTESDDPVKIKKHGGKKSKKKLASSTL